MRCSERFLDLTSELSNAAFDAVATFVSRILARKNAGESSARLSCLLPVCAARAFLGETFQQDETFHPLIACSLHTANNFKFTTLPPPPVGRAKKHRQPSRQTQVVPRVCRSRILLPRAMTRRPQLIALALSLALTLCVALATGAPVAQGQHHHTKPTTAPTPKWSDTDCDLCYFYGVDCHPSCT